ncbi:MAG: hypothetical protein P1V51_01855 [Deltaproteobacteria bacterium]|nr:hypothetical protein [Deltaproteobacteria bacterium]
MRKGLQLPVFLLAVGTVLVVAYLQASLVLVRLGGSELHWGVILFAVPVANGLAAALLTRKAYLASFLSSLLASGVLLVLYRTIFWKEPPSLVQAAGFFTTLALFSGFGVTGSKLIGGRARRGGHDAARRAVLVLYHLLAISAAVVTLVSYLQK